MLFDFFRDGSEIEFSSLPIGRKSPYRKLMDIAQRVQKLERDDLGSYKLNNEFYDLVDDFAEISLDLVDLMILDEEEKTYFKSKFKLTVTNTLFAIAVFFALSLGRDPNEIFKMEGAALTDDDMKTLGL